MFQCVQMTTSGYKTSFPCRLESHAILKVTSQQCDAGLVLCRDMHCGNSVIVRITVCVNTAFQVGFIDFILNNRDPARVYGSTDF